MVFNVLKISIDSCFRRNDPPNSHEAERTGNKVKKLFCRSLIPLGKRMFVMDNEYIQVITTTEKKEDAEKITGVLIEKRLAGCVQIIGPIASTYWLKNNIEKAEEWLCFIKSRGNLYKKIEDCIREIHPYETPEIICLPILEGSKDYLKWLDGELQK